MEEWAAEYKREGLVAGEARILSRLLQKRFGEVPDSVRLRLEAASAEQLESWAERLLDLQRLDALFDEDSSSVR